MEEGEPVFQRPYNTLMSLGASIRFRATNECVNVCNVCYS